MPTLYVEEYSDEELRATDDAIRAELDLKTKGAKELAELMAEPRNKICQLRETADAECRQFTADEKLQWLKANRTHDLLDHARQTKARVEQLVSAANKPQDQPAPGREDVASRGGQSAALARAGGDGARLPDVRRRRPDPRDPITDETRALALQGWLLRGAERPLRAEHRTALEKVGVRAGSKEFPIRIGRRAPRNQEELRALSVGTTTAGGYTVPQGFRDVLERALLQYGMIRTVATVMRTPTGAALPMPTINDTGNKGALLAENTQIAAQDVTFGQVTLNAYKMSSKLVLVSVELIQDSAFNLDELLGSLLGERIGRIENDYYTTGTGTAQPQGVVTGASLGATAASATAIAGDDLVKLVHALDPAYRPDATFMMHDAIMLAIRLLKTTTGAYLWSPDNFSNLVNGVPQRLLGYPVQINQSMSATIATTLKTVLFGNFSKFIIRDVSELRLRRLEERYADFDQVGFFAFHRTDSRVLDAGTHPLLYLAQA